MGPLLTLRERLPESFLVMNGDILTDLDYADVLRRHRASGAPLTIATYARKVHIDFGVLTTDQSRVVAFTEKPSMDYRVSMGVYGLSRATLDAYTPGLPLGFDELVLDLLESCLLYTRVRGVLAGHRAPGRLRPGERGVHQPQVDAAQGSLTSPCVFSSSATPAISAATSPGR